eukprot:UN21053
MIHLEKRKPRNEIRIKNYGSVTENDLRKFINKHINSLMTNETYFTTRGPKDVEGFDPSLAVAMKNTELNGVLCVILI